ncbi:MAG: hypothetical protein C0501_23930 [Isosphaera sp.]|nr:hypothetical protein [Isosphaera sp.]
MTAVRASVVLLLAASPVRADEPTAKLVSAKPGDPPAVEATGLPKELLANRTPKELAAVFRVAVAGGTAEELIARPPLAGSYALTPAGVRFDPQFPLVPGREYVAVLHPDPKGKPVLVTLSVPKPPPGPRVSLAAVYPSANRLPENTLRLYLQFSGPVARGNVYRHLKLVRDDGVEVKEPFLELPEELWSADGNRLTVFFHPGRVKRGLVPREEDGPILEEGRGYTLTVSGKWEDVDGRPLAAEFKKTFRAGPPDDHPVDLAEWSLMAPRSGSDTPLIVRLPKPLDRALLARMVWVEDAAGKRVAGELTVGGGERVLTFVPKAAWAKGEYRLVADTRLEDVCGNSVGKPFEVDVLGPVTPKIEAETAGRKFTVR